MCVVHSIPEINLFIRSEALTITVYSLIDIGIINACRCSIGLAEKTCSAAPIFPKKPVAWQRKKTRNDF